MNISILEILNNKNNLSIYEYDPNNSEYSVPNNNNNYKFMVKTFKSVKKILNIIGIFNTDLNVFYWNWSTNLDKNYSYKIKSLVNYAIDLNPSNPYNLYIKQILTSSSIEITNNDHLEIIIAIALYILKCKGYAMQKNTNYILYFGIFDYDIVSDKIIIIT